MCIKDQTESSKIICSTCPIVVETTTATLQLISAWLNVSLLLKKVLHCAHPCPPAKLLSFPSWFIMCCCCAEIISSVSYRPFESILFVNVSQRLFCLEMNVSGLVVDFFSVKSGFHILTFRIVIQIPLIWHWSWWLICVCCFILKEFGSVVFCHS